MANPGELLINVVRTSKPKALTGMCRKQLPCFPEICYQALRSEPNREEGSMDAYAPEIERKMKRLFDS
ncbi:MAG: hypothetical protein ACXVBY_21400, partial [Isosphaeraceae bacterium]